MKGKFMLGLKSLFKMGIASVGILYLSAAAHATTISGLTFTPSTIDAEVGVSSFTAIDFTVDSGAADVSFVFCRFVGSSCVEVVDTLTVPGATGSPTVIWDGLWEVSPGDGFEGRKNGVYRAQVVVDTTSFISNSVIIDSLDVHSFTISPAITGEGRTTFPVNIQFALAKDANVYLEIKNESNQVVYASSQTALAGESTVPLITTIWNGKGNTGAFSGLSVEKGIYTASVRAYTGSGATVSLQRVKSFSIGATSGNPQDVLKSSTKVYPNPVRDGQVTITFPTIRDGAITNLAIYTLSGDLVYEAKNISTGYIWNTDNAAGKKVGRGLYYVTLNQESAEGNLHTTKKLAVIQ